MSHTTHAAERAAERYGLTPTADDWFRALLDIIESCAGEARTATRLAVQDHGTERWLVCLAGVPVIAIYRPDAAAIITLAPPVSRMQGRDKGRIKQGKREVPGRGRRTRVMAEDWGE